MQLRGLVKGFTAFFTVALILISLYQLLFTFIARREEKKAMVKAEKMAKFEMPDAKGADLLELTDMYYERITDSMQAEVVMKAFFRDYTYADVKQQELNLGLDLQGGMNVTLEVSLDEMIRSMSNRPNDPILDTAIADANKAKANSQANFVTLFGEAFKANNPDKKLAEYFSKVSRKSITLNSTDEEVLAEINKEAKDAIVRTHRVILTRVDKFGVAQPNVNLDKDKGIITVELAGVRNPDRVRQYLQSTAKLQFFETYSNREIIGSLQEANQALATYLSGVEVTDSAAADSTTEEAIAKEEEDNGSDTASLAGMLGNTTADTTGNSDSSSLASQQELMKQNPLLAVWYPNVTQDNNVPDIPEVGYIAKRDTAKLNEYLQLQVVRNKFPNNVKFVYGSQNREAANDPKAPLAIYALQTMPGSKDAKLEGDHVTEARMDINPLNGEPEVVMDMDVSGSKMWRKMTGDNVDRFVAVVLDDKVYSAPRVQGEIAGGNTSISGNFSIQEATDLANILKSGKLPAPARIVQEQVVGPTLGAESIESGRNALILSFILIFVLMLVYYNTAGIVANIALILNLFFTIGILASLHATLTMPGIAGLVLTIGMAVDTNVIIFERIKEELSSGKTYQQAVLDGYRRSYSPVLDGHITTLITAVILFIFGLGPVLGFATTQIIGLLLSMFCGILISRMITDMWTSRERHFKYFTGISKKIFRKANFDFIGKRKIAYVISVVVLLAGIGSFFNGFNYGVEFAGGRSYKVRFDEVHPVAQVREKLEPYFNEFPVVKTIGSDNQLNITTSYLIEESGPDVDTKVRGQLFDGLKENNFLPADVTMDEFVSDYIQQSQTVLPTISDDLISGAKWATFLALIAISLYILGRFRRWQYSLGTLVALFHDIFVTLAVFSFFKDIVPFSLEIDQHFIAAILTVIGFSMNDTVVVFDRIREYFRKNPKDGKRTVINRAINDTLSRTVMTSLTVFITILILFIFGGEVTRGFAFAMLIGIVTGTYSSIFVAAPILIDMDKKDRLKDEVDREAQIEELKKMA